MVKYIKVIIFYIKWYYIYYNIFNITIKKFDCFSNYFLFYIFNETYKFLEKDNLFS